MLVEITLLIAAGLGNLAWDVTGRRVSARSRRRSRRARRRESLPLPAADEGAADPFAIVVGLAPREFVEQTRVIAEELDRVVDHFDLVLLRAQAGESMIGDIVYIGADAPRGRGRGLLRAWLDAVAALPTDLLERLRDLGLPDQPLAAMLTREHARGYWPHAATASELLEATAKDFEGAVIMLFGFLRTLTQLSGDPYR